MLRLLNEKRGYVTRVLPFLDNSVLKSLQYLYAYTQNTKCSCSVKKNEYTNQISLGSFNHNIFSVILAGV